MKSRYKSVRSIIAVIVMVAVVLGFASRLFAILQVLALIYSEAPQIWFCVCRFSVRRVCFCRKDAVLIVEIKVTAEGGFEIDVD